MLERAPRRRIGDGLPAGEILPLRAHGLHVKRDGRTILDNLSFEIAASPIITALIGPNGAGKSVLARILAGLVSPDRGSVLWAGLRPHRAKAARLGFVFQRPVVLRRSAQANVEYALALSDGKNQERAQRALAVLRDSGLAHLAATPAHLLSGGEQQRLALARTIAMNPELFVLDEPTANLDPASTLDIETQLKDIRAMGTPILLITHDIAQARRLADRVAFLHHGRILEDAPANAFFNAPASPQAASFIAGELVL